MVVVVWSLHELAVDEQSAGADDRDQVRAVDRPPRRDVTLHPTTLGAPAASGIRLGVDIRLRELVVYSSNSHTRRR